MHKTPGFLRNQGFCLSNLAVKERFETARLRFSQSESPVYKGFMAIVSAQAFPWQSHEFARMLRALRTRGDTQFFG